MSKIFNALRKTGQFDDPGMDAATRTDLAPQGQGTATATVVDGHPEQQNHEQAPEQPLPVATTETVSLRISALAPLFPFDDLHSEAAEQYRIIRTKIMHHPAEPRIIVISSASSGDGKTVTAINLAGVLALKQEHQILLIDADLRRHDLSSVLGLPETPGVASVLRGECSLDDALLRVEQIPNLWVLPAGTSDRNPAELLASARWHEVLAEAKSRFSYVVIDATPLAIVADFDLVQVACDGVILVMRPDHTNRRVCLKALESVSRDKLIGTILNCVEDWFLFKAQGYGYYS